MNGILGKSGVMKAFRSRLERIAAFDGHVLIEGGSGTGKELAAGALHRLSSRASASFVAVNCGALPESLLESQLFGWAKGAYTGASGAGDGFCHAADGGVLFLDEVGELPLSVQAALLRFLDSGEYMRVGECRARYSDVRVIAATNRDLQEMVSSGLFREDLYYRLSMLKIKTPELDSHREDIPEICRSILSGIGDGYVLTADAERELMLRSWRGNVRELRNVLWQAASNAGGRVIDIACLPAAFLTVLPENAAVHGGLHHAMEELRSRMVVNAMEKSGGNVSEAARLLGVHRNTLRGILAGRREPPDIAGHSRL